MSTKHVPGCAVRGALIEGPKPGESIHDAAARILHVRCTCRKVLAQAIALVLHPFAGQRLDAEAVASMESTVAAYLKRVGEKYEPIEWIVSLQVVPPFDQPSKDRAVHVLLVPPADLETTEAYQPEAKVVPPATVPAAEVELAIEEQTPYESHALVCDLCDYEEDGTHCAVGQRLIDIADGEVADPKGD